MKRIILPLFLLFATCVTAQERVNDISSPFKLWLLNNEARAFSSLSSDEMLISKVSAPFSLMPPGQSGGIKAEERLWQIHRKIYIFLDEVQNIYTIARQFGNGRLAIVFKQARPEIWSALPLISFKPALLPALSQDLRRVFHQTMLNSLNLKPDRDADLSARLTKAVKRLSDEEFRLLNDYFAAFAALYPSDGSIKVLRGFIETGSRKAFATGLSELLKPAAATVSSMAGAASTPEADDPLAELERLAQFDSGKISSLKEEPTAEANAGSDETSYDARQPETLEPPPEGVEDLFNIWD